MSSSSWEPAPTGPRRAATTRSSNNWRAGRSSPSSPAGTTTGSNASTAPGGSPSATTRWSTWWATSAAIFGSRWPRARPRREDREASQPRTTLREATMLKDIREVTDQQQYADELKHRWTSLLSYRYIGRNMSALNTGEVDNTVTLRHDMRNAT